MEGETVEMRKLMGQQAGDAGGDGGLKEWAVCVPVCLFAWRYWILVLVLVLVLRWNLEDAF